MGKLNFEFNIKNERVFLNGEHIADFLIDFNYEVKITVSEKYVNKLNNVKIIDFHDNDLYDVTLYLDKSFFNSFKSVYDLSFFSGIISIRFYKSLAHIYISLDLNSLSDLPITTIDFFKELSLSLSDYDLFRINTDQLISIKTIIDNGFLIDIKKDVRLMYIPGLFFKIKKYLKSSFFNTLTKIKRVNLSNTFTFPPEIQSSCEQYLIYFATFLKDIGINAETNIESKAHETLFTVIPKDGEEALDKIKEALHIYLSLPTSPEFESVASGFSDVGVQQLVSQVHFLKSQLALGKTMIQMKDATIEALQFTNFQQKEIIQSQQKEIENEEEIAGGLVKVKEVDLKILKFNIPELLRRIKRKFK
ncbi:hypothetical protein C8N46_10248 [Kordia periserrulae]|uniref:Uncharacterized protein n=1 Tax=Kordia periserrulae TaxID=701523 RepID=A0A2T6C2U4_9FLAO|nr:hypothetical protein [Kordia periserrulae]PTX62652.1 hypothetical protein C8N46_10248 [Kordia periserrulae]